MLVGVGVGVLVGADGLVGVGVGVLVGVGVGWAGASYEPMSHTAVPLPSPSCGRVTPFWDWLLTGGLAQVVVLPASIAGLPGCKGKKAGLPVNEPNNGSPEKAG